MRRVIQRCHREEGKYCVCKTVRTFLDKGQGRDTEFERMGRNGDGKITIKITHVWDVDQQGLY